jgi:transposase
MPDPSCPGCRELQGRVHELEEQLRGLEAQVRELLAKLKTDATNSSTPPSANPLGADKPVKKKKSERQRGGQPDHPPHLKQLLPTERVTRTKHIVPAACFHCQAALPREARPEDPAPKRFQTVEIPEIPVEVVEYQAHARTCADCGLITHATIPAEVRAHSIGPRLTAFLSYLSGAQGISKRGIEEIAEMAFGVPIALGTIANLEQEVSAAIAPAHQEALEAVRKADVKFADETSWKLWGKLCWLWAAATANIAVFVIHAKRGAVGLTALLGEEIHGILHSDRWHVYLQVPEERRQLCWAHLKRDFQKIVDGGGPSVFVGRRGLRIVKEVFAAWHRFQEGKVTRRQLQKLMEPMQGRLGKALVEGGLGSDARVAKFCENILMLEPALWTFVTQEGVEPTNNHMERLVRRAVLWRRKSFGCNSVNGCRFVERILTVVQTRRLHAKNVLEYLCAAVRNHRHGLSCPCLLS